MKRECFRKKQQGFEDLGEGENMLFEGLIDVCCIESLDGEEECDNT